MNFMKATQILLIAATLSAGLFAATSANANLVGSVDGQTIYDTDLNVTWLANANLAATNTFGISGINANGSMNWNTAQSWIGAMNTANYLGYNDWRLPTTTDASTIDACGGGSYYSGGCWGFNSTGSEMAHLFYSELGNKAYYSTAGVSNQPGYGLVSVGPFINLQPSLYWSGTEATMMGLNTAWLFNIGYGGQFFQNHSDNVEFVFAVRPGSVATVPVPTAAWLLGSGLLSLIGVARRKVA